MPPTRALCLMDQMWTQLPDLPNLSLSGKNNRVQQPICYFLSALTLR